MKNIIEARLKGPLEWNHYYTIQYLIKYYLKSPSENPYNLSKDPFYKQTNNLYTLDSIHNIVKSVFQNKTSGFFIEAGALDGEFLSNTLWLEKEMNWSGLLVEPNPYSYKELIKKNRKAWTSNSCLSTKPYPRKAIFVDVSKSKDLLMTRKWIYKGSSYELGYSLEKNDSFREYFAKSSSSYFKAQCFPVISYLLALNQTSIDFFSLDTQSSEWDILKNFPFDKIKVTLMVIERSGNRIPPIDQEFKDYFTKKGFVLIGCLGEPDYIFLNKDVFKESKFKEVNACIFGK